ncbi:MAG TPA: chloride channel protein, partial [Acidimicrobiales bacterium]|nr:chloride channel protein [Acidimicrobiales bacterium]
MSTALHPPAPVRNARARLTALLESLGYLRRWLVLGAVIGVVAGVGAIVFFEALRAATHWLLGTLGGYHVPDPVGEGAGRGSSGFSRPWAIPLVTAGGGLAAGLLVWRFAPEAEGHGTDAAISAVHQNPKGIRTRVSIIKILASAITIGSGGSGGREGPTAQISAGFGSVVARFLNLSPDDARIAVSVGVASGIGAIFRAPLGGAVLGGELLYRDDVEVEALIPALVASVMAFAVFGAAEGYNPIFGSVGGYAFSGKHLPYFAAVGIAAGLMGRLYASTFYSGTALFHRIRVPAPLKPAIGGLVVGLVGLAVPEVLGTGYGFLQQAMGGQMGRLSLIVIVALPFAKVFATSASIGSGGSGGIFGPGMVIGGFTGAAVYRLLAPVAPGIPHQPGAFAIVGMVACFGAIAHAPLAVILMVAEMTGSLSLLVPAMIAIALAVLVVGDTTIYRSQLRNRAESPAHRFAFAMPLSATVPVTEAMSPPRLVLASAAPASEALADLQEAGLPGAPVVDGDGRWRGMVLTELLRTRLADADDSESIGRLADATAVTVPADATLDAAITALATGTRSWVSVVDNDGKVVGIVATTDVINGYRMALQTSLRQLGRAGRGTLLVEEAVGEDAPVVGRAVHQLNLPAG